MTNRRLHIRLDEQHYQHLQAVAHLRRMPMSAVVRDLIGLDLRSEEDRLRREAGERFLASPPMDVPDVEQLLAELDALRSRYVDLDRRNPGDRPR